MTKTAPLLLFLIAALISHAGFAQNDSIRIDFCIVFGAQNMDEAGFYKALNNSYQIEKCRFYLSNFQLIDDDQNQLETIQRAFLLDLKNPD